MKNTLKILSFIMLAFFVSCDEASQGEDNGNMILNYGFKMAKDNFDIPAANPVYEMVVFATETSDVDRTLSVNVVMAANVVQNHSGSSPEALTDIVSMPTSVVIPAGQKSGSFDLTFDTTNLPIGTTRFVTFQVVGPGDGMYNISQDFTTISYTPECTDTKVSLTFNFDTYPDETGWSLSKGGVVIASKAAGTYATGTVTASEVFCLEAGAYTLTVTDSYGDGIAGSNPFVVQVIGGSVLLSNIPFPDSGVVAPNSVSANFTIN